MKGRRVIMLLMVVLGVLLPARAELPAAAKAATSETGTLRTTEGETLSWAELGMTDLIVYVGENSVSAPSGARTIGQTGSLRQAEAAVCPQRRWVALQSLCHLRQTGAIVYFLMQLRL